MKKIYEIKKIKKFTDNKDNIDNRGIRFQALKNLSELYIYGLESKPIGSKNKIFTENSKLMNLINKADLSSNDYNKINKIIFKDYLLLQKDLKFIHKTNKISYKVFNNKEKRSKEILYELEKIFQPKTKEFCIGKKTKEFCKKNKINLTFYSTLIVLGGLSVFMNNPSGVIASADTISQLQNNKIVYNNMDISKNFDNKSIFNILNYTHFSELDQIDLKNINFEKSKNLYLEFMNELIEKSDDKGKILLDNKQVLALIKGEYLYYTGIKKNLENKLSSLNDEEKELYLGKINITKEQLLLLKNNHQKIVEGKKEDFAYLKHDIEIQVEKKGDNYVVKGLDNFTY